jgi:hypothetical protein
MGMTEPQQQGQLRTNQDAEEAAKTENLHEFG